MAAPKGHKKWGGRKAGTPNTTTRDVRDMIVGSLAQAGGQEYLYKRSQDPETMSAYMTLVGRVLPKEITGEGGGPVVIQVVTGVPAPLTQKESAQ